MMRSIALVSILMLIQAGCCKLSPAGVRLQLGRYGDGKNFHHYATLLDIVRKDSKHLDYSTWGSTVFTGTCNKGETTFIERTDGHSGEKLYFASDTGKFEAITTWTDMATIWCGLSRHWPYKHRCSDLVVTELIRGDPLLVPPAPVSTHGGKKD